MTTTVTLLDKMWSVLYWKNYWAPTFKVCE